MQNEKEKFKKNQKCFLHFALHFDFCILNFAFVC